MTETRFVAALKERLPDQGDAALFPCIRDLLEHALCVARFPDGAPVPNRQDVTQYLAAWSKRVGLTEAACRDWLTDYCVTMLASISTATASRIRHSTKSNVRYIYRSGAPFACGREENRFKATCSRECPAYAEWKPEITTETSPAAPVVQNDRPADAGVSPYLPVKERYREQFQTALDLVRQESAKGTETRALLGLLHHHGLKTRTGREWTDVILRTEIRKMTATADDPCAPCPGTGAPGAAGDPSSPASSEAPPTER